MALWNWLDWIFTAVVVLSVAFAVRKGFVRELISLVTVVIGVIVASQEYQRAAGCLEDLTKSHEVALAAGFLLIFLAILVAGALVSSLARFLIKAAGIEWIDRFLGILFGLVRGLLVDCVFLMVLMAFSIKPTAVQHSRLAPFVSTGSRVIASAMPRELDNDFHAGFEKFRQDILRATAKNVALL
ncbi:MAG: CvpA family protein [Terriglobia bacterium]